MISCKGKSWTRIWAEGWWVRSNWLNFQIKFPPKFCSHVLHERKFGSWFLLAMVSVIRGILDDTVGPETEAPCHGGVAGAKYDGKTLHATINNTIDDPSLWFVCDPRNIPSSRGVKPKLFRTCFKTSDLKTSALTATKRLCAHCLRFCEPTGFDVFSKCPWKKKVIGATKSVKTRNQEFTKNKTLSWRTNDSAKGIVCCKCVIQANITNLCAKYTDYAGLCTFHQNLK